MSDETTLLHEQIAARAQEFSGQFGMFAKNLETGAEVGFNADAVMPTASVIKVAVLAELYRQVEAGQVSLEERREVTPEDWWGGSGVLKEFAPGLAPTINDLARMMIIVSDNVATGMLVRLLGKDAINSSLRGWGLPDTTLVWQMTLGDDIRNYAVSTPRELARLMELIATDAIISPGACAAMRDHLGRQQYLDQIPRYLPYDPYAVYVGGDAAMQIYNKTGFYTGVRADAAIVSAPECRFVIATMTDGSADPSFRVDHEGNLLNGAAARLVYDAWRA
ncbi:MAG: serine hydrolase [Thermomicrobiales bacterium]